MKGEVLDVKGADSSGVAGLLQADSLAIDSLAADSVAVDSVGEQSFGILLTPPERVTVLPKQGESTGMSLILSGLILLFAVIGLRFRNNRKYVTSLFRNLVATRLRQNVFDETVRETTFLVLLNLLWGCSAGILLFSLLRGGEFSFLRWHVDLPAPDAMVIHPAISMAICIGVGVVYTGFMATAYTMVGTVFSDLRHAKLWLKGFSASQGLLSFIWFPIALLSLFYPDWAPVILSVALFTFILAKIVFIWKGFRIFFTQFSSWVLFLYYLCSLEIVPLILASLAALFLCGLVG